MDAAEFFASVLPSTGPYVVASIHGQRVVHKVVSSFAKAQEESLQFAGQGADAYLCIGSITDREFRKDDGKLSPRNQKNIKELRSLILDIDVEVGHPKKYQTKEAALLGLYAFQQELQLPDPTVVDSGYGFHVYWPFAESVEPAQWLRLAQLLKRVAGAVDARLIADPTRVTDCASLLRVPFTINFKREAQAPTRVLALASEQKEAAYYGTTFADYAKAKGLSEKKEKPVKNSLTLFAATEKHSFLDVAKKCQWTQHYLLTKQSATEPEWYAMLGLVSATQLKGKTETQLAEYLSEGHPGFSATATARKLAQVKEAQTGPTLCARFMDLNPQRCLGCPFMEMVTTPARLDTVDLPADAPTISEEVLKEDGEKVIEVRQIPEPPMPYFRGKEGKGIYMYIGDDEDRTVRKIYEYDIFPVRRLKDEETDNEMLEISLTLPHDGHRFIKVQNGFLTDAKRLTAALADKGVLVQTKEAPFMTAYLIEYARKIQREEKAHEEFARFGWRDVDGANPRFVLGDFVLDAKGELRRATPAPYLNTVKDAVSIKGNLEAWKKGFGVYKNIDAPPLKFALLMGFAAPLLALTPFSGMIYNMLGDSGSGKSTALKLMTSVWGKPNEHHVQVHDNRIPMLNTIGYLQSIPVSFDELTTIASDTLADIAYSITEGRGKNRADRSGNTRANTVQWKTIVCGSSNSSLYEKLGMSKSGNNAHAYRIFEAMVDQADMKNRAAIDEALVLVEHNYGMAGRLFITYVIKNLPEVRATLIDATQRFAREFRMPTAERFWFTMFACMAVGGEIAKKLGLHEYSIEEQIAWCVEELGKVREIVSTVEGDAFSTFAHYMQMNLRNTLVVRDGKYNPLDLANSLNTLLIRMEYTADVPMFGFVSVPSIKEFCRHLSVEYGWMLKRLEDAKIVVEIVSKKLGEGTTMVTGQTRCWKVDLQHPVMQGRGA